MPHSKKIFPVSWDHFHRDCRAFAWKIAGLQKEWQAIVAITRGGLVPAAIISRELNIRLIETICIASYHDYSKQGELTVKKSVSREPTKNGGEAVLIIDDLADTGKTAVIIRINYPQCLFCNTLYQTAREAFSRFLYYGSQPGYMDLFPLGYRLYLSGADHQRRGLKQKPSNRSENQALRKYRQKPKEF